MNCTRSFQVEPQNLGLRHWCEQGDNLDSYGWNQHDGKNFGIQKIRDRGVQVCIQFSNKCQAIYEQLKYYRHFSISAFIIVDNFISEMEPFPGKGWT